MEDDTGSRRRENRMAQSRRRDLLSVRPSRRMECERRLVLAGEPDRHVDQQWVIGKVGQACLQGSSSSISFQEPKEARNLRRQPLNCDLLESVHSQNRITAFVCLQ